MEGTPDHKRPIRAVPDAGDEEREEQVAVGQQPAAAVPAQGDVHVVAEPGRQADMPARPEFAQARRQIGIVEIEDQVETHDLGHAACHVRVAAEIEEDLPAEGDGAEQQGRRAEGCGVVIDPLHVKREVVGQRQLS